MEANFIVPIFVPTSSTVLPYVHIRKPKVFQKSIAKFQCPDSSLKIERSNNLNDLIFGITYVTYSAHAPLKSSRTIEREKKQTNLQHLPTSTFFDYRLLRSPVLNPPDFVVHRFTARAIALGLMRGQNQLTAGFVRQANLPHHRRGSGGRRYGRRGCTLWSTAAAATAGGGV